jgi:hypothetical protein
LTEARRLRDELKSYFNMTLKLGLQIHRIEREIVARNREFIQEISQERQEYKEFLREIMLEAKDSWKNNNP